jgi:hypothetical protein
MVPALAPLRKRLRERISALAGLMGAHSRTTDVWVVLRTPSWGGDGAAVPNVVRILDCKLEKDRAVEFSVEVLRETVISTMEPVVMSDGKRILGNSICDCWC